MRSRHRSLMENFAVSPKPYTGEHRASSRRSITAKLAKEIFFKREKPVRPARNHPLGARLARRRAEGGATWRTSHRRILNSRPHTRPARLYLRFAKREVRRGSLPDRSGTGSVRGIARARVTQRDEWVTHDVSISNGTRRWPAPRPRVRLRRPHSLAAECGGSRFSRSAISIGRELRERRRRGRGSVDEEKEVAAALLVASAVLDGILQLSLSLTS